MGKIEILNLSRRGFLRAGAGLTLGIVAPLAWPQAARPGKAGAAAAGPAFEPNAFVRIGSDSSVTVIVELASFAFFVAVWGEVTPPTSISAAVTSKIAETSFMQTLFNAILICLGLFVLMAGVFTRPELVLAPGLAQIGAMLLIGTATVGITFSIQATFTEHRAIDLLLRIVLGAIALVVLLHPDRQVDWLACVPVALFVGYWVLRRRNAPMLARADAR